MRGKHATGEVAAPRASSAHEQRAQARPAPATHPLPWLQPATRSVHKPWYIMAGRVSDAVAAQGGSGTAASPASTRGGSKPKFMGVLHTALNDEAAKSVIDWLGALS